MKTYLAKITLNQLLYQKQNPIFNFTLQQFLIQNCHIGMSKKKRNVLNNTFIINTQKKLDLINLQKSIINLRIVLTLITNISTTNGHILTVLHTSKSNEQLYLNTITTKLNQNFIFTWPPGLLSNFKEFRQQQKKKNIQLFKIPNFIFFLTPIRLTELKTEIIPFQIPCSVIQNTDSANFYFLYPLTFNNTSFYTNFFFKQLIINSILIGYNKKILSFTKKKFIS